MTVMDGWQMWLLALALTVPRMLGTIVVTPYLGSSILPGLARNSLVIALSIFLLPMTVDQVSNVEFNLMSLVVIVAKEALIGFMLGYMFSIPIWAISAAGYFVDLQRGVMSAETFAPIIQDRTSPMGILLTQLMVTLLFVTGGFLLMYEVIAFSYKAWPIYNFFPQFNMAATEIWIKLLDKLMYVALLVAGPVIAIMFLVELGTAFIGRYVPQLNVFLLVIPIKSGVGIFMLVLYITYIARYMQDGFLEFGEIFSVLDALLS